MKKILVARMEHLTKIIRLLDEASPEEQRYLRYDKGDRDRIYKNVIGGRVHLFIVDEEIVGFLEYGYREDHIWIFSLYILPAYRKYSSAFIPVAFNAVKNIERKDIYFAVDVNNKPMNLLCAYIKAEKIREYVGGRNEWAVKLKKKKRNVRVGG